MIPKKNSHFIEKNIFDFEGCCRKGVEAGGPLGVGFNVPLKGCLRAGLFSKAKKCL